MHACSVIRRPLLLVGSRGTRDAAVEPCGGPLRACLPACLPLAHLLSEGSEGVHSVPVGQGLRDEPHRLLIVLCFAAAAIRYIGMLCCAAADGMKSHMD